METNFSPEQLSQPAIAYSNVELSACLQCGYCVDSCPTYQLLGDANDNPRGRIALIGKMLESRQAPDARTVKHIDRCLTCLACMSTCPSSVNYMHLLDHAREHIEEHYHRPLLEKMARWALASILPFPARLSLVVRSAQLIKPMAFLLPERLRTLLDLVPSRLPASLANYGPKVIQAESKRTHRVALLTGCAQQVLNRNINEATIRILHRHGCEIVIAKGAGCCGALVHHMGRTGESRTMAAANIRAWSDEIASAGLDAIIVNTSGCGTVIKDYVHMFRNDALAKDAARISALTMDITELLSKIELKYKNVAKLRLAYHATCSLQFGQRIRFVPKKLLKAAGFMVLEPQDQRVCCGAGGTYNLLQSKISSKLKDRKVKSLVRCAPDVIATGNIGCMIQIGSGADVPVVHTVELLDWATGGPIPPVMHDIDCNTH